MNIVVEEKLTEERIDQIEALFIGLGGFSRTVIKHALSDRVGVMCIYALINETMIGCKIGFSPRPGYFESWLGGVSKDHHRRGVATQLQEVQHAQCKNRGYTYLQTITSNDNLPMQIVNLKSGYKVVGTTIDRNKALKLFFEKALK